MCKLTNSKYLTTRVRVKSREGRLLHSKSLLNQIMLKSGLLILHFHLLFTYRKFSLLAKQIIFFFFAITLLLHFDSVPLIFSQIQTLNMYYISVIDPGNEVIS